MLWEAIQNIFAENYGAYGSLRVHQELKAQGFYVSENTVAKYMQELGIDTRLKKKFRVVTTDSKYSLAIAERLFKVEDHKTLPTGPGKVLA